MGAIPKAELGAVRRCDGMGEAAEDGDYVLMSVEHERERARVFRISLGAAAVLIQELRGCLAAGGKFGYRGMQGHAPGHSGDGSPAGDSA